MAKVDRKFELHILNVLKCQCDCHYIRLNINQIFFSNVDDSWTYSCEQNKCVRKSHLNESNNRVPFLSCAMICGDFNKIWPEPMTAHIQKSIANFSLKNVQYKVETSFENVADLVHKAMSLFVSDIKQIMKASGGKYEHDDNKNSTESDITNDHDDEITVNISIVVSKFDEVRLTLNSDECYHLSVTSEYFYKHKVIKEFNKIIILDDNKSITIEISSKSFFGARHGLETLQQLIWYDNAVRSLRILDSVNINDCPKFK